MYAGFGTRPRLYGRFQIIHLASKLQTPPPPITNNAIYLSIKISNKEPHATYAYEYTRSHIPVLTPLLTSTRGQQNPCVAVAKQRRLIVGLMSQVLNKSESRTRQACRMLAQINSLTICAHVHAQRERAKHCR